MHFFTQTSSSFHSTCPYQRSLFCCNTNASIPIVSLSTPYLQRTWPSYSLLPHLLTFSTYHNLVFFILTLMPLLSTLSLPLTFFQYSMVIYGRGDWWVHYGLTLRLFSRIPRIVYRYFWACLFFYFLVFLYSIFLVFGSVLIKMTYVSFWVHVKIVSHVVSYCKVLILVLFKDFQFQLELCKTVADFTKIKTSKQKW